MASRDTIIEVEDFRTGYKARINVPLEIIEMARRSEAKLNGWPTERVLKARAAVCLQAKSAMAKQGRIAGWLDWQDIAGSISIVANIEPQRSKPKSKARLQVVTSQPDTKPAPEQGSLFEF